VAEIVAFSALSSASSRTSLIDSTNRRARWTISMEESSKEVKKDGQDPSAIISPSSIPRADLASHEDDDNLKRKIPES